MTENEVVQILYDYFESLFPKVCTNCKRHFATLREYIEITNRIGPTLSYDGELGDWHTTKPIGTAALANCPCGNTLGLTTDKMPLELRQKLLDWVRLETEQRGLSPSELLDHLRDEVRKRVGLP